MAEQPAGRERASQDNQVTPEVDRLRRESSALVELLEEFAAHCEDSGWPATAAELRRRTREIRGGG